jgi:hypothetical protein
MTFDEVALLAMRSSRAIHTATADLSATDPEMIEIDVYVGSWVSFAARAQLRGLVRRYLEQYGPVGESYEIVVHVGEPSI